MSWVSILIESDVNDTIKKDGEEGKKDVNGETPSEDAENEKKDEDSKFPGVVSSFINKTNNNLICDDCGFPPCDGVTYKVTLQTTGAEANKHNHGHHHATRHHLYKLYIASKYGSLGLWNRPRMSNAHAQAGCCQLQKPHPAMRNTGPSSGDGLE